jgi:hypothetical protein
MSQSDNQLVPLYSLFFSVRSATLRETIARLQRRKVKPGLNFSLNSNRFQAFQSDSNQKKKKETPSPL